MIDTSPLLQWALIVFAVVTGSDGRETSTHSAPSFYATYADCTAEGERILEVAEPVPGVDVRMACIPRVMLRADLAMRPQPHH